MQKILIPVFIVVALVVAVAFSKGLISCTKEKIIKLEEQVSFMKEDAVPMRFEILKKKDRTIKVKVAFYDVTTNERVGKTETFNLEGEELFIDFNIIELSKKNFIFFPTGLFTNTMAIAESIPLSSLYEKNGFPLIYKSLSESNGTTENSEQAKRQLEEELALCFAEKQGYGTALHDLKTVTEFKQGFAYEVLCHPHTGGIEIRR